MSKTLSIQDEAINHDAGKGKSGLSRYHRARLMWCYLFLLPQTIMLLLFTLYPIFMSYYYSFFDWPGYGPVHKFVGFDNFIETMTEPLFWNAFKNSFVFMIALVFIQVPLALLLALLLNAKWLKGAAFYRALYFLPVVTTTAVVGVVMHAIFGAYNGLVNEVLLTLGWIAKPYDWLGSMDTALIIVIIVGIWKTFGMNMLYWLAGLQSLPKDVYEAATMDGAGIWQTFRYITLPLLIPVGSVIVLLSAVNALHVFDLVKSMTDGGPNFATDMVDLYIYRYAFKGDGIPRVGFASAAGVFYGFAVLIVSLVLGWFSKKSGGKRKTVY